MRRRIFAIFMMLILVGAVSGYGFISDAAEDEVIVEAWEETAPTLNLIGDSGAVPGAELSASGDPGTVPGAELSVPGDPGAVSGAELSMPGDPGTVPDAELSMPGAADQILDEEPSASGDSGAVWDTGLPASGALMDGSGMLGEADPEEAQAGNPDGDVQDGFAQEAGVSDAGTSAAGESRVEEIADPDGFIIEIEEVQMQPEGIAEDEKMSAPGQEAAVSYETETGTLEDTGLASSASRPQSAAMRITAQSYMSVGASGSDCYYGSQLSGNAKVVYDRMKEVLLGAAEPVDTEITFAAPITFDIDNYVKDTWETDKQTDAGYQAGMDTIRCTVQSAFDAFAYDCPQAYWLQAPGYGMRISIAKYNTGRVTGTVEAITLKLGSAALYTGAFADRAAFSAAVQAAVTEIRNVLPEGVSRRETVKAIHDYLCNKITYGDNVYGHSAVGVFLKGGTVVCEGYAKSLKILCEQFGINAVLIVGYADGAHMWNYVQMEDGNWYLVDATWDDQAGGIVDTYFLAGSSSVGFNGKTVSDERTVYTNFSGSATTTNFTIPQLSSKSYADTYGFSAHIHSWQRVEYKEPNCQESGYVKYKCESCGEEKPRVELEKTAHQFVYISDQNATCTHDGTMKEQCRICGFVGRTGLTEENSRLPHQYEYRSNGDATCEKDGTKTEVCTVCGSEGETVPDPGSRLPNHRFEVYTPYTEATCQKYATKISYCSYGCGTTDIIEDVEGGLSPHRFENYVLKDRPTCRQYGTKIAYCVWNCGAVDVISDTEGGLAAHSFKKYTSNNDATWKKDGTKTAVCSYGCGTKKTVTDKGSKLKPKLKLNYTSLKLKTKQTTSVVKVSGLVRGDAVKSWKSSNTKIVKVNSKGKITAQKKAGTAKITVTLKSGLKGTIKVTVQSGTVKTTKISGIPGTLTLKKGKTSKLKPVLSPITSQQKVSYSSSNKKVAAVSSSGKITAKKKGTATITIKSGSKTMKCKVKVK